MCKIFKTAIFAVAITTLSATATFAQSDGQSSMNDKITVTVLSAGTNCPPKGEVTSEWHWKYPNYPYTEGIKDGTSFTYPSVPFTGQCASIYPGLPWNTDPLRVKVKVIPHLHPEGAVSQMVSPPFAPIGMTPGPCYPLNTTNPPSN